MADFLLENPGGDDVSDILIRLYKTLGVMFSNIDSKNVTSIETNKTKVSSGDGLTEIDGAKIIMRDQNGDERLIMGGDRSGDFVFILKNAAGEETLSLSSDGDAVFGGDIKTDKDASVGNCIYLGKDDNTSGSKMIQFYDDETNDLKKVRIVVTKDAGGYAELKIIADKIIFSTLSRVYDGGGNSFVTAGEHSAYVEIEGVSYPVKFR